MISSLGIPCLIPKVLIIPIKKKEKRKKQRYPNKAGKQDSEAQISDLHEKQEEKLQMHSQPEHVKYKKHLEDD
jgi:hypothetical protein